MIIDSFILVCPFHLKSKWFSSFYSVENNNLIGTIPSEFGLFVGLADLCIGKHQYYRQTSCTVIISHATLNFLQNIANNQISGTLPSELGNLENLTALVLCKSYSAFLSYVAIKFKLIIIPTKRFIHVGSKQLFDWNNSFGTGSNRNFTRSGFR